MLLVFSVKTGVGILLCMSLDKELTITFVIL